MLSPVLLSKLLLIEVHIWAGHYVSWVFSAPSPYQLPEPSVPFYLIGGEEYQPLRVLMPRRIDIPCSNLLELSKNLELPPTLSLFAGDWKCLGAKSKQFEAQPDMLQVLAILIGSGFNIEICSQSPLTFFV
jgi:hypothetical protein